MRNQENAACGAMRRLSGPAGTGGQGPPLWGKMDMSCHPAGHFSELSDDKNEG